MPDFEITFRFSKEYTHTETITAKDADEANARASEMIANDELPEDDDFELSDTSWIDFDAVDD